MRDYLNEQAKTRFLFPIDGDYLNDRDGTAKRNTIEISVAVTSAPNCEIRVNGALAIEENGIYRATVCVSEDGTVLCAKNLTDRTEASVWTCYLPNATKKYRISSDDNLLFLADITENKDVYASIFENPYLAVYKKAHDLYDAKVHLNLFYDFDRAAAKCFRSERADFNLSMVTDKFKSEWQVNADWLQLSFHSRREMPDKPYQFAAPEEIVRDFLDVKREVLRFAGEECFSTDVTTIHYGEATEDGVAALRDLGHKVLAGYFEITDKGLPLVAYYAPIPLIEHVGERDFWRDTEIGIDFARIDRVTNEGAFPKVMADIQSIIDHPHRGGFVSFMIHEQYFYKDYKAHLSDFEARVLEPARLLWENGYRGSFLKELLPIKQA